MKVYWNVANSYGGSLFGPTFGLLVAVCGWAIISAYSAFFRRGNQSSNCFLICTGMVLGGLFAASNLYAVRGVEQLYFGGVLHLTTGQRDEELRIVLRTLVEWNALALLAIIIGFGPIHFFRKKRIIDDHEVQ